jgi:hypothetical protein
MKAAPPGATDVGLASNGSGNARTFACRSSVGTIREIVGGNVARIAGEIVSKFSGKSVARCFGGISCKFTPADRLQDRRHGSDRQIAG